MLTRQFIIEEIRKLAASNGGKPPGKTTFGVVTGIKESHWSGVFWARWTDALAEAGFQGNAMQGRLDSDAVLRQVATLTRRLRKVPTVAELKLEKRTDSNFPSNKTVKAHFGIKGISAALKRLGQTDEEFADILPFLPTVEDYAPTEFGNKALDGWVYLLKSGDHFKIGRSDTLERRVKEITVALPEAVTMIHAIRTDDPTGIEAYWHRRFADRRANGEWFRLDRSDVAAFRRRTSQ